MDKIYNLIIVGSGPAAYSAVLYTQKYNPLLFEGKIIGNCGPGGQLTTTTNVDNYPGFPNGIQGPELVEKMQRHVEGKCTVISETVNHISKTKNGNTKNEYFLVHAGEKVYKSRCVIIATGSQARRLFVEGTHDNEFWQKGISACAVCDGFLFGNKTVCVIGGGDTAMEETLHLSNIAKKIFLIHRRHEFRARKDLLEKVKNKNNVEILVPFSLKSAHGNKVLEYIFLTNNETNQEMKIETDGLFFAIGHDPNSWMIDSDILDHDKYIKTSSGVHTKIDGLFACGDVQDKKYRQAITAAGSGSEAGIAAGKYLSELLNEYN